MQRSHLQIRFTPKQWFGIFLLAHVVLWTVALTLSRNNAPFDSVEGVAWGRLWQWGYDKHPPLAPWLTAAVTQLFGAIDWPIYLLGMLSVALCFWATWRLALKFLPTTHALISVLLLEGIYYYTISAAQFNPNVLMLPLWALCILYFYNALTRQKFYDWLLVGLFAGLALLTKYESALLFFVMGLVLIFTKPGLQSFSKLGIYGGFIVFIIIIAPNILWLAQHDFTPFTYTVARANSKQLDNLPSIVNHLYYPLLYVVEQIGALLPLLFLYLPFYGSKKADWEVNHFDQRFILIMGLGPALVTGFISIITGTWIHSLWAFPFFSLSGIIMMLWFKPALNTQQLKRFAILFILFFIVLISARAGFLAFGPAWQHKTNSAQFPGKVIAATITNKWHNQYHCPLPYVAGHRTLVEHIATYSPDKPTPYFEWDRQQSPWIDEAKLLQQGAVFVWYSDSTGTSILPPAIAKRFPQAVPQHIIEFKHATAVTLEPIRVAIAYLPPTDCRSKQND